MTRQEYQKRAGALRKLTRSLIDATADQKVVEYAFGAMVDPETTLWHIYNYNTNNCIATVNFVNDTATIRYRERSHYSGVLKTFQYSIPTIQVKSSHLSRRSRWLKENLRPLVQRAIRSVRRTAPLEERVLAQAGFFRDSRGRLRDSNGRYVRDRGIEGVLHPSVSAGRSLTQRDIQRAFVQMRDTPRLEPNVNWSVSYNEIVQQFTPIQYGDSIYTVTESEGSEIADF